MEKRQKMKVRRLLAALIDKGFTTGVDSALLGLLGVPDGIVIITFLGSMPLIELTLILLIITGVRGVVARAGRRSTRYGCLAREASLEGGGSGHILAMLGSLLRARIHPEIKYMKERSNTRYGQDRTKIK
jgi:hypothetical protein